MTLCHWLASTICSSSKLTVLIWLATAPDWVTGTVPASVTALKTSPTKFSVTVTPLTVKAVLAWRACRFRA